MMVALAGRAAEQLVFGRVTNGAANDLEKVTQIARSMVFEWGMGESVQSRTLRADNYALSEETKRLRDTEQSRLTDHAHAEALPHARHAPLVARPRRRRPAREGDADPRRADRGLLLGRAESRASDTVGVVRALARRVAFPTRVRRTADPPSRDRRRRSRRGDRDATSALFGARLEHRETLADQGVEAALAPGRRRAGSSCSPPLGPETPVGRFLASRGPGMHHVAFQVDDLAAELARLAAEGAELDRRATAPRPLRPAGRVRSPGGDRRRSGRVGVR